MLLSSNYNMIVVCIVAPISRFLKMDKCMRLMLSPNSYKALPHKVSPMLQEIMKLHGPFTLGGNFPWTNWLHSWVNETIQNSLSLLLFVNI